MSTVHFALAYMPSVGASGRGMPIPSSIMIDDQIMSTTGATTITVPGNSAGVTGQTLFETAIAWIVTVSGGSVFVKFGPTGEGSPIASTPSPSDNTGSWLVLDGQTREFAARGGDKAHWIEAGF